MYAHLFSVWFKKWRHCGHICILTAMITLFWSITRRLCKLGYYSYDYSYIRSHIWSFIWHCFLWKGQSRSHRFSMAYISKSIQDNHSYYWWWIGSHIWGFIWHHCLWPGVTWRGQIEVRHISEGHNFETLAPVVPTFFLLFFIYLFIWRFLL